MPDTSLAEVLRNPHFNQYAAILSTAMNQAWRSKHPEVPSVRGTLDRFSRLVKTAALSDPAKQQFLSEFLGAYIAIVEADMRLLHRQEDMDWLLEIVDGGGIEMVAIFSMLFAVATARRQIYSLEQVAVTNELNAGTLKNRASRGEFVGAFKVAETNRWFFSEIGLLAQGLKIPQVAEQDEALAE
jgi:hypothetical protein